MLFLHTRVGALALVSVALFCQACVSKGDTVINGDKKPRVEKEPDAGSEQSSETTDDESTEETSDDTSDDSSDDTATETDTSDDDTQTETGSPDTDDPTDTETSPTDTETDPTETETDTDTDTTETDEEPVEPPGDPVACEQGLKPTKSEPVQLTTNGVSKSALKVLPTEEGYVLSWIEAGVVDKMAAFQMFDSDFMPKFEQQIVPEVTDVQNIAVAWTGSEAITAFDHAQTLRVARWDPETGELNGTKDTAVSTQGGKIFAQYLPNRLFLGTQIGGCPTTGKFIATLFDPVAEAASVDPFAGGGCIYEPFSVFPVASGEDTANRVGYLTAGYLQNPGIIGYVDFDTVKQVSGTSVDPGINVNQGAVMGYAQDLFSVAAINGGGVRYARLALDGTLAADAYDATTLPGTLQGLAFTDEAAGVLVENMSSVSLFARGIGDKENESYHPVGVVAAQKNLKESTLVTNDGKFVVFFLATDSKSKYQVFASEVMCEPE